MNGGEGDGRMAPNVQVQGTLDASNPSEILTIAVLLATETFTLSVGSANSQNSGETPVITR